MRYNADIIPVCEICAAEEKDEFRKICEKCGVEYCVHFSSTTNIRFCGNCLSDFKVKEELIIKRVEHLNDNDEIIRVQQYKAVSMTLEGTDWLFSARKIPTLTDVELEETIEYHRGTVSLMLQERESRRAEKAHKLANTKITLPAGRKSQYEREKDADKAAGKKIRTTTSKKSPTQSDLLKMIQTLQRAGITPEAIAAMAGKKG